MFKKSIAAVSTAVFFMFAPVLAQTPNITGNAFQTQQAGKTVQGMVGMCVNASNQAVPCGTSGTSNSVSFSTYAIAQIARSANTTTYTTNTGWNNPTPTFFSFTSACRVIGGQVLIPRIDIWSSANPTTKLQGTLWLFSAVPGTNVSDNATFTIAAADYANLTGGFSGIAFTLANNQASGAANSGVSLVGTTYQAQCASGTTTITGMVEVTNAYVPANGETLHVGLATIGLN